MDLNPFIKNLALLKKKDPALTKTLKSFCPGKDWVVTTSKKGPPSLSKILPNGKRISLHSSYDPIREAGRLIDSCEIKGHENFFILGLGLGYHVQELIKRVPHSSRILIFEKEMEVIFHCLAKNDFSTVIAHPGASFLIGVDPSLLEGILEPDRIRFALNGYSIIKFKPLINVDIDYYSDLLKKVDAIISETKIDLKTQAAFSREFYRNIFDNWKNILNSPGIHSIKNQFSGTPAIIVSAGPSLDKNIGLLKKISQKVLVIAVATALRALTLNGIKVDFVVAIDPEESTNQFFNFKKLHQNVCLVFDPCVPPSIVDHFAKRKIRVDSSVYLSQWLAFRMEENNFLGKTLSVAHTAFLFARHLGCDPIILVGQDLAFDRKRLHCADSYYDELLKDKIGPIRPLNQLEKARFFEFSPSFKFVKDIFEKEIVTTSALNAYKNMFADKVDGTGSIFNATEGGLPIPGISDISLREAFNAFCPQNNRSIKNTGNVGIRKANGFKKMKLGLNEQSRRFDKVNQETKKIKSKYFGSSDAPDCFKNEFVGRMEKLYRLLLDQPETLQLMQGYSYGRFLEWNQKNRKIAMKEGMKPEKEVIEDKFQRDKKFLGVLEETSELLKSAFEKMAREVV